MIFKLPKRLGTVLLLISALPLTNCASQTSSNAKSDFCLIASPITWAAKDTDGTIAQIKSHNAVGAKLCGW